MILAATAVALPLVLVALLARRFRSDFEEAAWRLVAIAMILTPLASLLPKVDVGLHLPLLTADEVVFTNAPPLQLRTSSTFSTFSTFSTSSVLLAIYGAIALALLVRLLFAAIAAWRLRRDAQPFAGAYVSPSLRVPVTAGLLRPAVLLPHDARSWSDAKLAAVLSHEQAHVGRRDPLWRFVSRLATAVCWFHPLAWLAASSIERLAEEAADREAVAATGDRHLYADVLLDLLRTMAGTRRRLLAPAILDGRPLGERIDAILVPARVRRSPAAARALLALAVAGAIFLTAMTKREVPAPVTVNMQQQLSQEEMFRARDEFRQLVRERMRGFFRGTFRGWFRGQHR